MENRAEDAWRNLGEHFRNLLKERKENTRKISVLLEAAEKARKRLEGLPFKANFDVRNLLDRAIAFAKEEQV